MVLRVVRRIAVLCFVLAMLVSGPLAAAAQTGTPESTSFSAPAVGDAITWIGVEGTEKAKITVNEITDPFDDYDSNSAPERGFHFVAASVTIENTGDSSLSVDPSAFSLIDPDGFVSRSYSIYRSEESTAADPNLEYGDLAAGDSVTGLVGFQALNGTTVERVVFSPDGTQFLTLVDNRTSGVAIGSPVTILGADGTEAGEVTITAVYDPFEDYDSSNPPQRGRHWVGIEVSFENTGSRPVEVGNFNFYLIDNDGFQSYATYVYREDATNPPDFTGGEIAPGETMSGFIPFDILNGQTIAQFIYSDNIYSQQTIIGEPAAGGTPTTQATRTPADETPTTIEPPDDEDDDAEATVATAPDPAACEGLEPWVTSTQDRITGYLETVGPIFVTISTAPTELEEADLRDASTRAGELAEEQRNSNPPTAGEAANDLLVDLYTGFETGFTDLADAVAAQDQAAITTAVAALQSVGDSLDSDEADAINDAFTAACPELDTIGDDD